MWTAPTPLQWLNVAVNLILPMVVALVTHRTAEGWLKSVTLLVLSAVSGFGLSVIEAYQAHVPPDLGVSAWNALVGLIIAVGVHFGVWKPIGATGSDGWIQRTVPTGVGATR